MAGAKDDATIVIKKVIKVAGGHHGGGWKVAYADFVTAMMAFFLLLWLLNVTSSEQRQGIADYFAPSAASIATESGSGGLLAGKSMAEEGVQADAMAPPVVTFEITSPKGAQDEDSRSTKQAGDTPPTDQPPPEPSSEQTAEQTPEQAPEQRSEDAAPRPPTEAEIQRQLAENEQAMFEETQRNIDVAIADLEDSEAIRRSLIIDSTPEGLRIQITDRDGKSMFPSGSAAMHDHMAELIAKIARVLERTPNRISITGHTDSVPYRGDRAYGNWELSSDRANASRRALIEYGVSDDRISYVSGRAATEPLIEADPSLPANRRISIVLLRNNPVNTGSSAR